MFNLDKANMHHLLALPWNLCMTLTCYSSVKLQKNPAEKVKQERSWTRTDRWRFPYYLIFSSARMSLTPGPRCMRGAGVTTDRLSLSRAPRVTGGRGQPWAGGDWAPAPGHERPHGQLQVRPDLLRPAAHRAPALAHSPRHPEAIGWVKTDVTNLVTFSGRWRGGGGKPTSRPLLARHVPGENHLSGLFAHYNSVVANVARHA